MSTDTELLEGEGRVCMILNQATGQVQFSWQNMTERDVAYCCALVQQYAINQLLEKDKEEVKE